MTRPGAGQRARVSPTQTLPLSALPTDPGPPSPLGPGLPHFAACRRSSGALPTPTPQLRSPGFPPSPRPARSARPGAGRQRRDGGPAQDARGWGPAGDPALTSLLRPAVRVGIRGVGPVPVVRQPHQLILVVVVLVFQLRLPQHLAHRAHRAAAGGGEFRARGSASSWPLATSLNWGFVWSAAGAGGGGGASSPGGRPPGLGPAVLCAPGAPSPPLPPAGGGLNRSAAVPPRGGRETA